MTIFDTGVQTTTDTMSLAISGQKLSPSEKRRKMPLPTASGGISREWFKPGSRNPKCLSWTIGTTIVLQNAIKYCTKVCKRVWPAQLRIIRPQFDARAPVMTH